MPTSELNCDTHFTNCSAMLSHSSFTCNLYCSEDVEEINVARDNTANGYRQTAIPDISSFLDNSDLPISDLLDSEIHYQPMPDYLSRIRSGAINAGNRGNAIKWILKVHRFFAFQPATAYLAVNYLDRFLSCKSLPQGNGDWPWQLLSVACLSVAAKMEETRVPQLLDLQTMCSNTHFLFEPRTVQRMELFLITSLQWRLRSTTPFDFLNHFAGGNNRRLLLNRSSEIVLGTFGVLELLVYLPSAIAGAAIVCAAEEIGVDCSSLYDTIDKEIADSCRSLMVKRNEASMAGILPRSQVAVLEAVDCGSCQSNLSSDIRPADVEPPGKRPRLDSGQCTKK